LRCSINPKPVCAELVGPKATEGQPLPFSSYRRALPQEGQCFDKLSMDGSGRLQAVMERLMEEHSFEAVDRGGESVTIDEAYVKDRLDSLAKDTVLSKCIL
jgi:hypothetical protein